MNWHIKPKASENFLKQFPECSPLIGQLLYNRGLKNQLQIDEFFNPDYGQDLHNPFLMRGMKKAIKRIDLALEKKEKIVIYGDYDADGICASAVLRETINALGGKNLSVYIPNRTNERHGLNRNAIEKFANDKVSLIITVDCASRDVEEVDFAKSLNIDVIITDHHRTGDKLPKAVAIVNPWQEGDKYPFKELSGTGVAYKLAQAMLLKCQGNIDKSIGQGFEKWLLDLVAIATVADMSPILGENRTLVKYGLAVLTQTKRIGLRALMEIAKLNPIVIQHSINGEAPLTNLNTYTLGYVLGPRLNAASRMDHADTAFHLLIAEDEESAKLLAQKLDENNKQRQVLIEKIVNEAKKRIESASKISELIFEGDANWPVGIIGLVASKIAEKYHRPTIIYQEREGFSKASCRSILQFNIIEAIEQCGSLLETFGGHKGAAGFEVSNEKREEVKNKLNQIVKEKLEGEDLAAFIDIESEMNLEDISWKNYDQIQSFAPFGSANPEPKFLINGLEVSDLKVVGNGGKHLKLTVNDRFKVIGFNLGLWREKLRVGDKIDLVFEFIVNEWDGMRDLQLKAIDIRHADE